MKRILRSLKSRAARDLTIPLRRKRLFGVDGLYYKKPKDLAESIQKDATVTVYALLKDREDWNRLKRYCGIVDRQRHTLRCCWFVPRQQSPPLGTACENQEKPAVPG
jgi:hypothetical protein